MTNRSVVTFIILSIVTCGIYLIYWQIVTQDELNRLTSEDEPSGVVCFLLSLVTCGIYGIYWAYKLGDRIGKQSGNSNLGIVNLVLNIVGYAITQNEMNKLN